MDADQGEKKDLRESHDGRGIRRQGTAKGAGFDAGKKDEARQDRRPQQERPLHAGPQGGEFVARVQVPARMRGDIVNLKPVREKEHFENAHRRDAEHEIRRDRTLRAQGQPHAPSSSGPYRNDHRISRDEQREIKEKIAELWKHG